MSGRIALTSQECASPLATTLEPLRALVTCLVSMGAERVGQFVSLSLPWSVGSFQHSPALWFAHLLSSFFFPIICKCWCA
jgi:hypothetical protein